jgi:hypothetical protein
MRNLLKCAAVAFIAFIATTVAFTQEWTKAQKEVWQIVEDGWAKWKAGDYAGGEAYLHEKYQGWNDQIPLPITKARVVQQNLEYKDVSKLEHYSLNPARIVITENAAVVDYYYSAQTTYKTGEKTVPYNFHGKNAEFYVKEAGKWLLLGDMTTIVVEKDDNDDDD